MFAIANGLLMLPKQSTSSIVVNPIGHAYFLLLMKQIKPIYFFAYPWGMHLQLDKALTASSASVDIPLEIILCNQFQSHWVAHC